MPINQTSPLRPTHDEIMNKMSLNQTSPLVPIKPNGFLKNVSNRSSFCGVPHSPGGDGTLLKTFAVNRKSWSGNGTLPLQQYSYLERELPHTVAPELGTFKTGTFPRRRNAGALPLTPIGSEARRSGAPGPGRRYAEIGNWAKRSSTFLEPHLQGVGVKSQRGRLAAAGSSDSDSGADEERALLRRGSPRSSARRRAHHAGRSTPLHDESDSRGVLESDSRAGPEADSRGCPETVPAGDKAGDSFPVPAPRTHIYRPPEPEGSAGDSVSQSRASSSCSGSSCSSCTGPRAPCSVGLLERLLRTHPVWFLPGIQRAGAFHLLQGKEEGNFVVRQSSQSDTMAISVRLPTDKGPYIEHYLIQAGAGRIGLETSQNKFNNIPELIAHYSQCCDELPVQLTLPRALREAKNRQQLSSLALLGQEFWRYPMANPRSGQQPPSPGGALPMAVTPSDTGSSVGSFNTGAQDNNILSLDNMNSEQNIVLNLAPIENSGSPPHTAQNSLSTFKACSLPISNLNQPNGNMVRAPRPTPPNTLNLISSTAHLTQPNLYIPSLESSPPHHLSNGNLKSIPPPPPPRWAKPPFATSTRSLASPTSCSSEIKMFSALNKVSQASGNITVTTTVTFSVNNTQIHNHQINENMSDDQLQLTLASNSINNNLVDPGVVNEAIKFHCSAASGAQSLSRRLSPEGECISSIAATLHGSFKRQFAQGESNPSQTDTNFNMSQPQTNPPISPETVGNTFTKSASTSFVHSHQMTSPNGSISVTSGIFSPTSQINSPMSNGTISSKSGIFSPVSQLTNKSEVFSPLSRSSPLSGKSVFSPVSNQSSFNSPLMGKDREKVLSPNTNTSSTTPSGRSRRSKHSLRKESRHYQESDILESPDVYYRSSLNDKVSDYEDIWGPDHGNTNCSTFKPIKQETDNPNSGLMMSKRPDLLPDTLPKLVNAKSTLSVIEPDKLQSFTASTDSLYNKIPILQAAKPPILYHEPPNEIIATTNSKGEIVPKRPDKLSITRNVNKLLSEEIELEKSDAAVESQVTSDTDISHIVKSDESLLSDVDEPQKEGPGSPFYADPVDAIKEAAALPLVQRRKLLRVGMAQRYSEPPNNNHPYYPLRDMHSIEELSPSSPNTSSSVDNLIALRTNRPKVKPVQPPRIVKPPNSKHDQTWAVDSSWEFIGKNEEGGACSESGTFPSLAEQESRLSGVDDSRHQLTVHHILAQRFPDLRLSPAPRALEDGRTGTSAQEAAAAEEARAARTSCYDNVNESKRGASSQASDDGTVFSEPWDTSRWDGLLPPAYDSSAAYDAEDDDSGTIKEDSSDSLPEPCQRRHCTPHLATVSRAKSFRDRLDPLLAPPRLQALRGHRGAGAPGAALRAYALHLSADKSTTFAQNVDNFIACTLDSKEIRPQIVMRNMRQFMSGMKNYLVKHGEREFEKEVEKERLKLKPNEFLNLDAILEGVMHRLVVRPLRSRLYALLADWHAADVRSLAESISLARDKTPLEIGIRPSTTVPSSTALSVISKHFLKMQEADSPLDKLESLLAAISAIFNSIRSECAVGADDLLPVLVWVLVRCSLVCAELEAELMAGLLPPALLAGEGGYYLTTLFSAVAVLKKLKADSVTGDASLDWRNQSLGSCASSSSTSCSAAVLRVALPDECRGSIRRVALPYRPGARAKELCRALAHAAAITNPQDYALFALVNGHETILGENDCPQEFMSEKSGKNCILAYKRIDAKIAWPQQALQSSP